MYRKMSYMVALATRVSLHLWRWTWKCLAASVCVITLVVFFIVPIWSKINMMKQRYKHGYDFDGSQCLSWSLSSFLWASHWKRLYMSSFPILYVWQWSMAQFIKSVFFHGTSRDSIPEFIHELEQNIWLKWEQYYDLQQDSKSKKENRSLLLEITTIDFTATVDNKACREFGNYLCPSSLEDVSADYLDRHLGKFWRERPILFRGMWNKTQLTADSKGGKNNNSASGRRLSLHGLKYDEILSNVEVTYFTDASKYGALVPDSKPTPIHEIISLLEDNKDGSKAKIGSQIPVQKIPSLIKDVAPSNFVTSLFGDRFQPKHLSKTAGIFPASTTVPIFVAAASRSKNTDDKTIANSDHPRTDLHCEPIGNIAVQLNGEKQWTLVSPDYMHLLRPSISWNGRAFFYSMINPNSQTFAQKVPHFKSVTKPGDGLWVPPWTWHQVDYTVNSPTENIKTNDKISLAASLFHFRPMEFWNNNPLFALLVIPNMIKEVLGLNTE